MNLSNINYLQRLSRLKYFLHLLQTEGRGGRLIHFLSQIQSWCWWQENMELGWYFYISCSEASMILLLLKPTTAVFCLDAAAAAADIYLNPGAAYGNCTCSSLSDTALKNIIRCILTSSSDAAPPLGGRRWQTVRVHVVVVHTDSSTLTLWKFFSLSVFSLSEENKTSQWAQVLQKLLGSLTTSSF